MLHQRVYHVPWLEDIYRLHRDPRVLQPPQLFPNMGLTPSRFRRYQTHQARYEAAEYRDYQLEESNRPEMPGHWHFRFDWLPWPLNKVFEKSLRMLCLVAFGHSDLEALHYVCVASEKTWMESTSRLADRLNTIIVVVSIVHPSNFFHSHSKHEIADQYIPSRRDCC